MLQPFSSKALRSEVGRSPGSPESCLTFPSDCVGQWLRDTLYPGITVAGQLPTSPFRRWQNGVHGIPFSSRLAASRTGHQLQNIEKNKSLLRRYNTAKHLSSTSVFLKTSDSNNRLARPISSGSKNFIAARTGSQTRHSVDFTHTAEYPYVSA